MATIISRAMAYAGYQAGAAENGGDFADEADIQVWAKEAVKLLRQSGILTGDADTAFNPSDEATRAESAAMLNRLLAVLTFNK